MIFQRKKTEKTDKKTEKKLTFNITYYPALQNVRKIMEELHILLTSNKEHRNVFSDVPVVGFQNGKSLKDYLVRALLEDYLRRVKNVNHVGKKLAWSVIL